MKIKKLFSIVILIVLMTINFLTAQSLLPGKWQGSIKTPGQELEVILEFTSENDQLKGFIDIPVQNAMDIPLQNIIVKENNVSFAIKGIPGNPKFDGTISADKDSIKGDFTQSGGTFPFSLARITKQQKQEQAQKLEEKLKSLHTFIDTTMDKWHVAGLSVAVVKEDSILWAKGFGYRDYEEKVPVNSQTLFPIGSSTKAFTSFAAGLLVDEGLLDWDTPIHEYMPDFEMQDNFAANEMTTIDLLTHRSGLPRHDLMWYGADFTREEMYNRLQYLKPNKPFRYDFQYQNLMYLTAGLMIGRISKSSWEDVVAQRIFEPLQMSNSNFSVDVSQMSDNYSLPYKTNKNDEIEKMKFRRISAMGPAGSINSCADDMTQWLKLLLNKGKIGDTQLMMEDTFANLIKPHMVFGNESSTEEFTYTAYGLGWFLHTYRGHPYVEHGGNIDGFSALVSLLPDDDLGIVVLTNQNASSYPKIVTYNIMDRFLDLEPVDWHARKLQKLEKMKEIKEESKDLERVPDTEPSHELEDYVGIYENPGYGNMEIGLTDGELHFILHSFASPLEHWHYDVFKPTEGLPAESNILLEFHNNVQGEIDKLSAPLEVTVAPIEFEKLPPAKMSDPELLSRFSGKYDMAGNIVKVELNKAGKLVLTFPGQPVYELKPSSHNKFELVNNEEITVKFHMQQDEVTALSFIQPNGVFKAEKMEEETEK
ncbi:MAG: serine hydrolase [Candidatus Cloacimonetes bacterium]|nr:serine hydrolase [Candidatus Cloacimonadota bacterium]MBS3767101.1 serine hydrolase [Candidatus Cloacimonadota bacterium]